MRKISMEDADALLQKVSGLVNEAQLLLDKCPSKQVRLEIARFCVQYLEMCNHPNITSTHRLGKHERIMFN
jgi:hypothetical protein